MGPDPNCVQASSEISTNPLKSICIYRGVYPMHVYCNFYCSPAKKTGSDPPLFWAGYLHSLERTERMMVKWMCGVSLKDKKKCRLDLYSLLGVQSVADVVRHGRLRWFGHLECKNVDHWVSACRNVEVAASEM